LSYGRTVVLLVLFLRVCCVRVWWPVVVLACSLAAVRIAPVCVCVRICDSLDASFWACYWPAVCVIRGCDGRCCVTTVMRVCCAIENCFWTQLCAFCCEGFWLFLCVTVHGGGCDYVRSGKLVDGFGCPLLCVVIVCFCVIFVCLLYCDPLRFCCAGYFISLGFVTFPQEFCDFRITFPQEFCDFRIGMFVTSMWQLFWWQLFWTYLDYFWFLDNK